MKRILIVLFILFLNLNASPAEEQVKETYKLNGQVEYDDNLIETIYLDDNIEKPEVNIPQRTLTLPVWVLNITSNTNTSRSALARAMVNRNNLSDILPLSANASAQAGGFSYGTTWGQEISYAQMESTTAFFLRYDTPKLFSLDASIRQYTNKGIDAQYNSLRISPEWHITDKLTLKNALSYYPQLQKNKSELTLVYNPVLKKYADSLKFELGIAQSYYSTGNTSESLTFSTGFRI